MKVVDKVRKSKVDLLMTKITQFVVNAGEGPNKVFYRMMTLVTNIRDFGGNDLDDHIIVMIMFNLVLSLNGLTLPKLR
jgi:hypothetical protein